jgi:hypothetical protein
MGNTLARRFHPAKSGSLDTGVARHLEDLRAAVRRVEERAHAAGFDGG